MPRRDDIRALQEEQAHIHGEMLKLEQRSREENRDFTAEEKQEFDKLVSDFELKQEQRTRAERLFAQDVDVQKVQHTSVEKRAGLDGSGEPESFKDYRNRTREKPWGADLPEVRSAYYKHLVLGWQNLDVEEQRALSKASGAAGNYLVPQDMAQEIARAERFMGSFQELTNVIETESGETINIPTNLAHGTATHTAESGSLSPSDETFGQVPLGANKITSKIIVSSELLKDNGFDLAAYISREFGERIAQVKETALVQGSGTGQAQGVATTGGALPVYTAAVGNSTSFSYAALVTGIFALPAQYRQGASFLVADAAARNLYLMVDGQNRPLWSVNVASNGPDTFLGYPIRTHPDLIAPGVSAKSVLFGNFRRAYTTRIVRGYSLQRQDELHSDNDQVGFRAAQRYDGKVVNPNAALVFQHSAT